MHFECAFIPHASVQRREIGLNTLTRLRRRIMHTPPSATSLRVGLGLRFRCPRGGLFGLGEKWIAITLLLILLSLIAADQLTRSG